MIFLYLSKRRGGICEKVARKAVKESFKALIKKSWLGTKNQL
jgi:hypothetical protein